MRQQIQEQQRRAQGGFLTNSEPAAVGMKTFVNSAKDQVPLIEISTKQGMILEGARSEQSTSLVEFRIYNKLID